MSAATTRVLRSPKDLPKKEALGIFLRRHTAFAAPVSVLTGTRTQESFQLEYELSDDIEANKKIVSDTLAKIVDHFAWKGVVGCSVVAFIGDRLGGSPEKVVKGCIGETVAFVHTLAVRDAAAYYQLVWGSDAAEECWKEKLVLVCILGADLDMTLLNDGRRILNTPGFHYKDPIDRWRKQVKAALNSTSEAPELPSPGGPDWDAWVGAVDQRMTEAVMEFEGKLDRIILVPHGKLALESEYRLDASKLPRVAQAASEQGCALSLPDSGGEHLVEGAALAAIVELQTAQLMKQLKPLLQNTDSLQSLSEDQTRMLFESIDTKGEGKLKTPELMHLLELVGVPRDAETLKQELDTDKSGFVSLEEFRDWWRRTVASAKVVIISSSEAWRSLLARKPPEGYGDFVLLEVTFTFCRSCKLFEPKFKKLAEEYPTIRFVNLVGNGTVGAMDLSTKELGVTASPAFYVFRRSTGECFSSWVGKTPETLHLRLSEVLELEAKESGKVPA